MIFSLLATLVRTIARRVAQITIPASLNIAAPPSSCLKNWSLDRECGFEWGRFKCARFTWPARPTRRPVAIGQAACLINVREGTFSSCDPAFGSWSGPPLKDRPQTASASPAEAVSVLARSCRNDHPRSAVAGARFGPNGRCVLRSATSRSSHRSRRRPESRAGLNPRYQTNSF